MNPRTDEGRLSSGIDGLDRVLNGGYIPGRSYLVRGQPGVGKTLLGLHFLTAEEDDSMFVNLGEPEADIRTDATAFGFDLEDVSFLDLTPSADYFVDDRSYDIFPADEVEGESFTQRITDAIEEADPDRVFVDPLTQLRYLTADDYQFRKQVLSFLQYLKERDATVIFTSQDTRATPDDDLQFMSDGIVHLAYEDDRRTLEVSKFRGSAFDGGTHTATIDDAGMSVFPRLRPAAHGMDFDPETISSGISELDTLLSGGLERGTITILSGPSGVGKTTTGSQFLREAARRGERAVIYLFEESLATFKHRSEVIGVPIEEMMASGNLAVYEIEAARQSAEEFAEHVRTEVEERDAAVVMLDGTDGYEMVVGDPDEVRRNLAALGRYFKNTGVTGIFVTEVGAITGEFEVTDHKVSYLADNIVFLRYLEVEGELRKAIGVLKKRASDFERTLREFEITEDGLTVGEPLSGLRGILQGKPEWVDRRER